MGQDRTFEHHQKHHGFSCPRPLICWLKGAQVERRLAAILAADVTGYSRLMGLDEERTRRAQQVKVNFCSCT